MEAVINYVFMTLSGLADKYAWLSYTLMAIGGLYVFLTAIRAFLSKIVRLTPTGKDDKIVDKVYAFLDKYAYGFGKLADYYEKKTDEKADKAQDK